MLPGQKHKTQILPITLPSSGRFTDGTQSNMFAGVLFCGAPVGFGGFVWVCLKIGVPLKNGCAPSVSL